MSQTTLKPELVNLYETDYLAWVELTLTKLRSRDLTTIDWDNIIEEIADMGKSTRSSFKSNLRIVLQHLLKWQLASSETSISKKTFPNTCPYT